ncbi:MAG: hypothetical protein D4R58_02720, partial [Betaproteobacteria bacterium]
IERLGERIRSKLGDDELGRRAHAIGRALVPVTADEFAEKISIEDANDLVDEFGEMIQRSQRGQPPKTLHPDYIPALVATFESDHGN